MKKLIFTFHSSLSLLSSFFFFSGISHAQSTFEVPAGFEMQKVHRAFKETGTAFDWYRISNASIAFFIYDMSET